MDKRLFCTDISGELYRITFDENGKLDNDKVARIIIHSVVKLATIGCTNLLIGYVRHLILCFMNDDTSPFIHKKIDGHEYYMTSNESTLAINITALSDGDYLISFLSAVEMLP